MNEWYELTYKKKDQVEKSHEQLEFKNVPCTSINKCFCNFLLRPNVKHKEIKTTARAMDAYASEKAQAAVYF